MNRLIGKLAAFCFIFLIVDIAAVCVGGEILPKSKSKYFMRYLRFGVGHTYRRLAEAREISGVDILFIGTSHCYRTFDPRFFARFGYRIFNFGTSMQSPLQTELLLEKYLDRIRPKSVVLEINPVALVSDGVESGSDLIGNDSIDIRTLAMVARVNNLKMYNSLIFALYKQVSGTAPTDERLERHRDHYISGGYVESPLIVNTSRPPAYAAPYHLATVQLEALDRAIALIKKRHIPLVMIQVPVPRAEYRLQSKNAEVDARLSKKGRYVNFNETAADPLYLDDVADYMDNNHLNQRGAEKFDAYFIRKLNDDPLFAKIRSAARRENP